MFSTLKRIFGGFGGSGGAPEPNFETVEHNGYRIRPEPFSDGGQYQTAGVIEKDTPEGVKQHRFIRAEKHASREDAAQFSVMKAKQIVNEQGDHIFNERKG